MKMWLFSPLIFKSLRTSGRWFPVTSQSEQRIIISDFFPSLTARYKVTSKQWHYYSGTLMGVQGTKKSAEALHEIFMGIFLFSPLLPLQTQEWKASKPDVLRTRCRNGSCRPIFDLLGEGGIERALPLQSQLPLFLILTSCFSNN